MPLGDRSPHPAEYVLADYCDEIADELTTARVRAHLAGCTACRALLTGSPAAMNDRDQAARLMGEAPSWPSALLEAMGTLAAAPPAVGQLWRVRTPDPFGEGTDLADLVVLISVGDTVLAAPATTDRPESTDLWTVHLPADGWPDDIAVWVSLALPIGLEALDVLLGSVDPAVVTEVHRALRRGQEPPTGPVLGGSLNDELREYRANLSANLGLIADARLLAPAEAAEAGVDVVEAIAEAQWSLQRIAEVTGLPAGAARAVKNGTRTLDEEQRAAVGRALGLPVGAGQATVPLGWVRAVAAPTRRGRFERVAHAQQVDPWQFRAGRASELVAARGNSGGDHDWDELVEQLLRRLEYDAGLVEG